jgi:hypothetical protein
MIHSFQYNAHNLLELFQGTTKFSGRKGWKSKLEAQSTLNEDKYPRLNYVGDGFEFFVELMFKVLGPIPEFGGIYDYQPQEEHDNGVDGICKNWDGKLSVVQVKYKRDSERLLTANADHLGNLVKEATLKYRISPHKVHKREVSKYFVITTGKSLHYYTNDEFFLNNVKCIGWDQLCKILDHNLGFWEKAEQIIKNLHIKNS